MFTNTYIDTLINILQISINKSQQSVNNSYFGKLLHNIREDKSYFDAIINPLDTRKWISNGIEAANHSPITDKFNLGVIQV